MTTINDNKKTIEDLNNHKPDCQCGVCARARDKEDIADMLDEISSWLNDYSGGPTHRLSPEDHRRRLNEALNAIIMLLKEKL